MKSHLTRRALLASSLGAAQFALLDRMGLLRSVHADPGPNAPTRLLVLYIPGGVRFYPAFVPFSAAEIPRYIPAPTSADGEPIFFRPDQIVTLEGDSGGFLPLRLGRNWNPTNPGDRTGYRYSPMGYSWIHYALAPTTAVVHGIDQGSFAHASAFVSAMCGIAGEAYRAPALVSVVANYLHTRFASARPLACVAINASSVPQAYNLPAQATPAVVPNLGILGSMFSSDGMRNMRWESSDRRTMRNVPTFDGAGTVNDVGLTNVDALLLERTRALRGRGGSGSDALYEQIYNSYVSTSRTLARDVVRAVEAAVPVTVMRPPHLREFDHFNFTFGLANGRIDMTASCEWILKLLKSNITSTIFANLPERYYDTHNGGSIANTAAAARAQLDIIARMLGEMKATPSPDRPGRTLYDDTLVVVQSEFNRTFMTGPNQEPDAVWQNGDDHNPITSVVLSGGGLLGNRQIGGFEEHGTRGAAVDITEEDGRTVSRSPKSDLVASVCRLFGMRPGVDFFIPGGFGVIRGLCP
jgi:hypothetical protein